jgi:hypothetical protein
MAATLSLDAPIHFSEPSQIVSGVRHGLCVSAVMDPRCLILNSPFRISSESKRAGCLCGGGSANAGDRAAFIVMAVSDCIGFASDPCAARVHRRFQIVSVHSIDAFLAMPGH